MRSGRIILLLGVMLAVIAALAFLFLFRSQGGTAGTGTLPALPSAIPERDIVIARIDIPVNTVLTDTEAFFITGKISEIDFNTKPGFYFTNFSDLQGKITTRSITANNPITSESVRNGGLSLLMPTPAPDQPSRKALPLQVNTMTGVADLIEPGDFVDVIVSFRMERSYLRPSIAYQADKDTYRVTFTDDKFTDGSTKTLAQNLQVLRVLKPRVDEGMTPTPASQQVVVGPDGSVVGPDGQSVAGSANTFMVGNWVVILAVTDQEAEIIRYSLQEAEGVSLVLRGRGDTAVEQTLGVTMNILMSQYGLPEPLPALPPPAPMTDLTPTAAP